MSDEQPQPHSDDEAHQGVEDVLVGHRDAGVAVQEPAQGEDPQGDHPCNTVNAAHNNGHQDQSRNVYCPGTRLPGSLSVVHSRK